MYCTFFCIVVCEVCTKCMLLSNPIEHLVHVQLCCTYKVPGIFTLYKTQHVLLYYYRVQSRVLVYFVIGEFYQNWTSPLVPTMDTAQDYTKSFAFGKNLQSTIGLRLKEGSLFNNICIVGSDIIKKPTNVHMTLDVAAWIIIVVAAVVVVLFLASACTLILCICCYCALMGRKAEQ